MNKGMNVTSLERSAMANLKGGRQAAETVWCPNNISCAGVKNSYKDQLQVQNNTTALR